jgi:hypothetical protein
MPDQELPDGNNDAIWMVEPTDFVTPYAPLKESIFDDMPRLRAAWDLTVSSLESEKRAASLGPKERPDAPSQSTPSVIQSLNRHMSEIESERQRAAGQAAADAEAPRTVPPDTGLFARLFRSAQPGSAQS